MQPLRATTPATEAARSTRERLLDTAERLFASGGFAATSVRTITAEVGCNLAAVNYHFGSKDGLYREMFLRRLGRLREHRIAAINGVMKAAAKPSLELLLRAFTSAFLGPLVSEGDGRLWAQLTSRELLEPRLPPGMFAAELIDPVHEVLVDALRRICPGLDAQAARRCTHSLVGQLLHFVNMERYYERSPQARPGTLALPELLHHAVAFSAAGIRGLASRAAAGRDSAGIP
ncbi:MAG TPA: CerR family C-terminal domain-containing protein [Thermoanaerobaculia bacterium]|nr:CerR family C-terminal domain-containing protein [Thermoanaerobaculia bacterium]